MDECENANKRCGTCSQRIDGGSCKPGSGWGWCSLINNYTCEDQTPEELGCGCYIKKNEE